MKPLLGQLPKGEIESYTLRIGSSSADIIDVENEHVAALTVNLTPFSSRKRTAEEIVEDLRQRALRIDGVTSLIFQLDVGGPPTGNPIEMRIIGSDDYLRTQLATDIIAYLNTSGRDKRY